MCVCLLFCLQSIFITKIAPGGIAESDGRLRLGDKLLSVCVCVRVCVHACVRACVCVCVCASASVCCTLVIAPLNKHKYIHTYISTCTYLYVYARV